METENQTVKAVANSILESFSKGKYVKDKYGVRALQENCDKHFKATIHLDHGDGKTERVEVSHPSHIRSAVHKKVEEIRKNGFAGEFRVDYHHD